MDGYQVRPARGDAEDMEVIRIIGNGLYDYPMEELRKIQDREGLAVPPYHLRLARRPGTTVVLIGPCGSIVGGSRVTSDPDKNRDPDTGALEHWSTTAILPDHRGKGMSSKLREAVLLMSPATVIRSRVKEDNPASWKLAERLGYEFEGSENGERMYRLRRSPKFASVAGQLALRAWRNLLNP